MKIKKTIKAPKVKDEFDDKTKSILDTQLDKLVIEKPTNPLIQPG